MTILHWQFDREFCAIETHPYTPARLTPSAVAPCALDWRMAGRLMAGALWLGCVVGVLAAIIAGT